MADSEIEKILGANDGKVVPQKWRALVKKVPSKKRAGLRESCVFVFNNIWNEPDEIEVDEIPGRGALRLLSMAQGAGYAAFLQFYQKSVSEKGSSEAAAEDAMRARQLSGHLEKWLEEFNKPEAKDV